VTSASTELRDVLICRAEWEDKKPHRADFIFKSYEAFVLAYGRGYESASLDKTERAHVKHMLREHRAWRQRGFKYNHCFGNSQEHMSFDKTGKVVYVEGYVWPHGDRLPPVHHGWLTLHGKVIDLTVVTRAIAHPEKLPPEPLQVHGEFKGRAYFGVPFLRRYVRDCVSTGWGSVLDDEENVYPLLKHGGDGAVRETPRT